MREFQTKHSWKKYLYSKWTVIALFIVFLVFSRATWRVYWRETATAENREKIEASVAAARESNEALKEQINELSTVSGMDEEIRRTFSVSKQGEEVAVIINPTATGTVETKEEPVSRSWWQRAIEVFKF